MREVITTMYEHLCKRCGNVWQSKSQHPVQCSKCHSSYWHKEPRK
jgi:hypothetical protein